MISAGQVDKTAAAIRDGAVAVQSIARAADIGATLLQGIIPAAATIIPIVRNILLPASEAVITASEYTRIVLALNAMEAALATIVTATADERARVGAMTDAEVDEYARSMGLFRDEQGTP
jgi:hypothetical protein